MKEFSFISFVFFFAAQEKRAEKVGDTTNEKKKRNATAARNLKKKLEKVQTPLVEIESIYNILPKAEKYIPNHEIPVPRYIWKEKDWPEGFPSSPEEAGTDLFTFLEQKDCYRRLKKMQFKEFCVGSFVEVKYADQCATGGANRLVGVLKGKFSGRILYQESP